MDNAAIYHIDGIGDLINEVGALVLFLPPYSQTIIRLKRHSQNEKLLLEPSEIDFEDMMLAAFSHITKEIINEVSTGALGVTHRECFLARVPYDYATVRSSDARVSYMSLLRSECHQLGCESLLLQCERHQLQC